VPRPYQLTQQDVRRVQRCRHHRAASGQVATLTYGRRCRTLRRAVCLPAIDCQASSCRPLRVVHHFGS
jgi:hypothetical protein